MKIGKFFLKNRKIFLIFLQNLFLFCFLLIILEKYTIISVNKFVNLNLIRFLLATSPFFWFLLLINKNRDNYQKKLEPYLKYGFFLGLILIIIPSFNFNFLNNIVLLKLIIGLLSKYSFLIIILTSYLGFFVFYFNKEKLNQKIEYEKNKEELEEEKRKLEFPQKFEKLNKIPIIKNIAKRLYGEGWKYSGLLIIIFAIGVFFRLWNLGKLSIWGDEGTVFIASKNVITTGLPYLETGFLYLRDLPHIYLTAASLKLFNLNEYALRLPVAISSSFLSIIIYLISKKIINKNFSLVASLIIAIHPWIIEHSRIARSYGLMVFFLMISYYLFTKIIETKKTCYVVWFIFFGLLTATTHQTGQVVLLLFIPLILSYFEKSKLIIDKKKNLKLFLNSLPFLVISAGIIFSKIIFKKGYYVATDQRIEKFQEIQQLVLFKKFLSMIPLGTPKMENFLFIFNPMPIISTITIIFLIIFLLNYNKIKKNTKILTATTLIFVFIIIFSQKEIKINRAILFLFPFFTLTTITGLYYTTKLFFSSKKLYLIQLIIIILTSLYLIHSSSKIIFANYGDYIPPYHSAFEGFIFRQDQKTTYEYVNKHYKEGDIVLVYGVPQYSVMYAKFIPNFRVWSGKTLTFNNKNYTTGILEINNPNDVQNIIDANNRVWIITSYSIFSRTKMAPGIFHLSNSLIRQLEKFNDKIVYQSKDQSARVYLIEK